MGDPRSPSGRPAGRPRGSHWSAGTDVHMLSLMHRTQARLYRAEQRAILARLVKEREADPAQEMTGADAEKLARVDRFLARATQSVLDLNAARDKLRASTDTDVLVIQLRHEFTLAARSFTDDELEILAKHLRPEAWAVLDRVRAQRLGDGRWEAG